MPKHQNIWIITVTSFSVLPEREPGRLGGWRDLKHREKHNNERTPVRHLNCFPPNRKTVEPILQEKLKLHKVVLLVANLLQTLGYRLQFMAYLLHGKVNVEFEVQFKKHFAALFMWDKLSVVPNLEEFLLLNIVKCVQQNGWSLLRYCSASNWNNIYVYVHSLCHEENQCTILSGSW